MRAVTDRWKELAPRRREIVVALAVPVLLLGAALSGEAILRAKQLRDTGSAQLVEFAPAAKPRSATPGGKLAASASAAVPGKNDPTAVASGPAWRHDGNRRYPGAYAKFGPVAMNAQGVRAKPLAVPKPAEIIRIGFYGASTTLGLEVADDAQTWPAVAMRQVETAYPGCRFEFYNAGVIGYNLDAIARRLEHETRPLAPDLAVFLLSDINMRILQQLRERGLTVEPYLPSPLARASILWQKLEKNAEALRLQRLAVRPDAALRIDPDALRADFDARLAAFAARVDRVGVPQAWVENAPRMRREHTPRELVEIASSRLLYVPGVYIGDVLESLYRYNDAQASVAGAHGIPYYRTLAHVSDAGQNYTDSTHFTARGNLHFGEAVGKSLALDPRLARLATARGCAP